jgi:ubiquinone/menaquinone biosynthesis C-methylase UbiE
MTVREAVTFLRQGAGEATSQTWADLGAGTFTRALAQHVGEQGRIIAVDHDDAAIP